MRAAQLRRGLQSERHVLCVHPADPRPDLAYEAATIQGDTGYVLFPLLSEAQHPGIRRLAALAHAWQELDAETPPPEGLSTTRHRPADFPRLVAIERWSSDEVLIDTDGEA